MKKLLSLTMCLVLMLSMVAVSAVSVSAVAVTADEGIADTGLNAEIQSTGAITPVNLGDSFYARINMLKVDGYRVTAPASISSPPSLRKSNDYNTQIWHFTRDGSTYRIRSVYNNRYIEMNGSEVKDGATLYHTTKRNAAEQKWMISKDAAGYRIHSSVDERYVLICVNPTASASRLELSSASKNNRAYFKFQKLSFTSDLLDTPVLKVANGLEGVQLKWSKVQKALQYRIHRYNETTKKWKIIANVSGTSYLDKDVTSGTTYQYAVKTLSPLLSGYQLKTIKYIAAPVVTINNTDNGPYVTWKKVTGAKMYRVFVHNGTKWKTLGETTGTAYLHKDFAYNKTYKYTVRCLDSDGKTFTSAYDTKGVSNVIVRSPAVTAVVMPFSCDLSWKKTAGTASYYVYCKSKASSWKWVQIASTKETSFSYNKVVSNNGYYFAVRSVDASGKIISGFKSTDLVKYYEAPCVFDITAGSKVKQLSWYPVDGAYQYRVLAWNGQKWVIKGTTAAYTTTFNATIAGSAKQNVCYAVRCLDKDGKYISHYLETVIEGDLRYYYPGEYSKTHKF